MGTFETILGIAGTLMILAMWAMNKLQKVNPASLFYIGMIAGGYLLLFAATLVDDAEMFALTNWPMQIILFFISTWLMALFFRKRN